MTSETAFNAEPEVKSPCVSICVLDDAQLCLGCGRTRNEIGCWSLATADEQRKICALAKQRLEAMV